MFYFVALLPEVSGRQGVDRRVGGVWVGCGWVCDSGGWVGGCVIRAMDLGHTIYVYIQ